MRGQSRFIEMFYNDNFICEKLKAHIEVIRGVSYKPTDVRDAKDKDSSVILRSNNILNGLINYDDIVFVDSTRVSEAQELSKGDIVMCGSNGSKNLVGKAAMITEAPLHKTSFGAFCLGIRCKDTIHPKYLSSYFQTSIYRNKIEELGTGSNILNIKPDYINNMEIPVPRIEQQLKFVSIAEQADKSKFVGFKSRFIEMFGNPVTNTQGWKTSKLKDVAPETPSRELLSGKVGVLNLDMIESNTGKVIKKVYDNVENTLSVQAFDESNVLFSKLRPYLNKVVVPDEKGLATTELVPLRPNPTKLLKVFLSHLLRSDQFVNFANGIATGTKMPRMPLKELRNFECILPPLNLQNQFVSIAEQSDKSKYNEQKS